MTKFSVSSMRFTGLTAVAVLSTMVFTLTAHAGSKLIRPSQFKPFQSSLVTWTFGENNITAGGDASLYAPVSLPPGKRVKSVVYEHKGAAACVATVVRLSRRRFGSTEEVMSHGFSNDTSGTMLLIGDADGVIQHPLVTRSHFYFVTATLTGTLCRLGAVKIVYR